MTPTFKARTRLVDVLILICVVALTAAITFAWVDLRDRLHQTRSSMAAVMTHLTALESKGASTVIFNLPEVKGSPYWNIDQKGWDLATPELSSPPEKTPTKSGGSRKGG